MATLYREFGRQDFEIVAISDDVDRGKMTAFVRAFRPPFPIVAGGGRMKAIYHYRGLPYSVLLDRHGRVIERIFGFGGAGAFAQLHATIANEVRVPYPSGRDRTRSSLHPHHPPHRRAPARH